MPQPVRTTVIGCGEISREHLTFLAESPLVQLVGVCDRSPATARFAAERYGAVGPDGSAAWFTDHREMLAATAPDVVHILTPPASHASIVRDALAVGAHVVCEKPITPDGTVLASLQAEAASAGRMLIESQNMRFNDQVLRLEELVADGSLGTPVRTEVTICLDIAQSGKFADAHVPAAGIGLPGGAIHDFLPHMSYLGLHFFGYPELERALSMWRNVSGNPQVVWDEMESIVEFEGGRTCALRYSCRQQPPRFRVAVYGTGGAAETDMWYPFLRVDRAHGESKLSALVANAVNGVALTGSSVRNLKDKLLQHSPYHGMPRMLEGFYRAVVDGTEAPITPQQIRRTIAVIDAVVAGARS